MSHEIEVSVKFVVSSSMWPYWTFHQVMIERTKEALEDIEANSGGFIKILSFSLGQRDDSWQQIGRNTP